MRIKKAYAHIEKALNSKTWRNADKTRKDSRPSELEVQTLMSTSSQRRKLLIIGNGSKQDLSEDEARYIASSLAPIYDVIAGTLNGNPGLILDSFREVGIGSSQFYQPRDSSDDYDNKEVFGMPIIFHGETKEEFRENLVESADAVLVHGGNEGKLR